MADPVEGSAAARVCNRDGLATRLTCVECGTPICPRCLVAGPVGMKCPDCGEKPGSRQERRRPWAALVPVAALVLVVLGVLLPRIVSSGGSGAPPLDEVPLGSVPDASGVVRGGRIGLEVRDANLAFVVHSFSCGATEVPGPGGTRTAQGHYCEVTLDVSNSGRGPATFPGRLQTLVDSAGRRFGPDVAATAGHPANAGRDLLAPVVNPGNTLSGVLVFDVPPDTNVRSVELRAGPQGLGARVGVASP